MDIFGDNYKPEYASLNPLMCVPTLEIDDKIITDSRLIADYLMKTHPGPGDKHLAAAGKSSEITAFLDLVGAWDEALYTYGNLKPGSGSLINALRIVELRKHCASLGEGTPLLHNGTHLEHAYAKKIAAIEHFDSQVSGSLTAEKEAALKENKLQLDQIWATANKFLQEVGATAFLCGPELTTADGYFIAIAFRQMDMYPKDFESCLEQFPSMRGYWARVIKSEDAKAVTTYTSAWAGKNIMLPHCIPCKVIATKLGCMRRRKLSKEVEDKITEAKAALRQ